MHEALSGAVDGDTDRMRAALRELSDEDLAALSTGLDRLYPFVVAKRAANIALGAMREDEGAGEKGGEKR